MKRTTMFLAGCLAIGVAGNACMAQNDPAKPRVGAKTDVQKPGQDQMHGYNGAPRSRHLSHASQILNMTLRDPQGKEIGSVEDMVIDSRGRVAFLIVSFENDFVADGKLHAVPLRALRPGSDPDRKDLILSTTKDKIVATSGFTKDQYPQFDEQSTRDRFRQYDQTPYWEGQMEDRNRDRNTAIGKQNDDDHRREFNQVPQFDRQHVWTSRASEIIGKMVVNSNNDNSGRIKDLLVDFRQNRVVYAVLTNGGVMGMDETLTPIPYSALKASGDKDQFTLDAAKDSFEAISFKESAWPDMTNRQWAQRLHTQFNQDPYWAVYSIANTDDVDMHWRRDSAYNKGYNAQLSTTVKGTVTSVSEFSPETGAANGRQIMLRSDDGKTYTVHMGPSSFMQWQDSTFAIKQGDELTITGSIAKFQDKDVLIANQIRNKDGKTLELRDNTGRPMWDNQDRGNDRGTDQPTADNRM
ncbi:MAG: PRC-barrel domain-containing protein [Phycisphaeraceae bacterium]|nr:PRC-barrel domain-containing protein [Phycisphaeraceae bacterium]